MKKWSQMQVFIGFLLALPWGNAVTSPLCVESKNHCCTQYQQLPHRCDRQQSCLHCQSNSTGKIPVLTTQTIPDAKPHESIEQKYPLLASQDVILAETPLRILCTEWLPNFHPPPLV